MGLVLVAVTAVLTLLHPATVTSEFLVDEMYVKPYTKLADVNIAFLVSTEKTKKLECRPTGQGWMSRIPLMADWVVQKINQDQMLPNSLQLGYVIYDVCDSRPTMLTILGSLYFNHGQCRTVNSQELCLVNDTYDGYLVDRKYYVVGAVADLESNILKDITKIEIRDVVFLPLITPSATLSDFSVRQDYKYLWRVVSSDTTQAEAIVQFLSYFRFTYFVLVFPNNEAGHAMEKILGTKIESKACFSRSYPVTLPFKQDEADEMVDDIMRNYNTSRVILFLVDLDSMKKVAKTINKFTDEGKIEPYYFSWVASTTLFNSMLKRIYRKNVDKNSFLKNFAATFVVTPALARETAFDEWYNKLTLSDTDLPWFKKAFEKVHGSTTNTQAQICPQGHQPSDACRSNGGIGVGRFVDATKILVNATARVIKEDCPNVTSATIHTCDIDKNKINDEIGKTNQNGHLGHLQFHTDSNDPMHSSWNILQLMPSDTVYDGYTMETVFEYKDTSEFIKKKDPVWTIYSKSGGVSTGMKAPPSRCSEPCKGNQVKRFTKGDCCWTCQQCKKNEYQKPKDDSGSNSNSTKEQEFSCKSCPALHWANKDKYFKSCYKLNIDYTRFDVLSGMGLLNIGFCVFTLWVFYIKRERKVIKASDLIMSVMMLMGIMLGMIYIIFFFLITPTEGVCYMQFIIYSFSYSLIYCAIFLRALRIYYIFSSSIKSRNFRYSNMKELTGRVGLAIWLSLRLIICIIIIVVPVPQKNTTYLRQHTDFNQTWVIIEQNDLQDSTVVTACKIYEEALIGTLCLDGLAMMGCLVMAFMTRQLPSQFNESKYMFLTVAVSLVLFTPTFPILVITKSPIDRMSLIRLIVYLNDTLCFLFLFVPKLYYALGSEHDEKFNTLAVVKEERYSVKFGTSEKGNRSRDTGSRSQTGTAKDTKDTKQGLSSIHASSIGSSDVDGKGKGLKIKSRISINTSTELGETTSNTKNPESSGDAEVKSEAEVKSKPSATDRNVSISDNIQVKEIRSNEMYSVVKTRSSVASKEGFVHKTESEKQ